MTFPRLIIAPSLSPFLPSFLLVTYFCQPGLELSGREVPPDERLQDAPRPGGPASFSIEQITHLYAIACHPPEKYDRPISHWSARELADEMVKQGIVESISERHVGRLLKEADLKPHQSRYWLHPPPTLISRTKSKTSAPRTRKPVSEQSGGS